MNSNIKASYIVVYAMHTRTVEQADGISGNPHFSQLTCPMHAWAYACTHAYVFASMNKWTHIMWDYLHFSTVPYFLNIAQPTV
jgi:hypothetical protein